MITAWATVVSWQNGEALVRCETTSSCGSCASRIGCGSRILNKLGPRAAHTLVVPYDRELTPGQKVELGVAEQSLLGSAVLVYMAPLLGLFALASLFQAIWSSDSAAILGAILGGGLGFLAARLYAPYLSRRAKWQPVILNVGIIIGQSSARESSRFEQE
ncbi:SoxR-reducing system protein RseC [Apirhabdus apintestini]|uniref:SoxR-reducing system protein RseC n=1 Tax=Erwinia sp. HR93 TaxID=3094840 RepID=UPI002ADEE944|nr:SoxR-reducing system protein RseC [Erwinia sp. HR93]MEA1064282.1 SoxR-reducing system protein RseC [Erwinia sp. HR93]WPM85417.1 SoxR-reducing system protein RseC [Enterobacteriaceae bacterium CA-0114]